MFVCILLLVAQATLMTNLCASEYGEDYGMELQDEYLASAEEEEEPSHLRFLQPPAEMMNAFPFPQLPNNFGFGGNQGMGGVAQQAPVPRQTVQQPNQPRGSFHKAPPTDMAGQGQYQQRRELGNTEGNKGTTKRRRTAPCSCGMAEKLTDSRIVGGVNATLRYPWMASLWMSMNGVPSHFCGAAIIADNFVVTAAHCKENIPAPPDEDQDTYFDKNVEIIINATNYNNMDYVIRRKAKKVIMHENFTTDTYDSDIALIELDQPISIKEFIPICYKHDENYVGRYGRTMGWGYTQNPEELEDEEKMKTLSKTLLEVELPILSLQQCRTQTAWTPEEITDNMICAGSLQMSGKDACQGDSGGPFMLQDGRSDLKFYLIGLVSYGKDSCGVAGTPGIYTRVAHFVDWIDKHLQEKNAQTCKYS